MSDDSTPSFGGAQTSSEPHDTLMGSLSSIARGLLCGSCLFASGCARDYVCPPLLIMEGAESVSHYEEGGRENANLIYRASLEEIAVEECVNPLGGPGEIGLRLGARIAPGPAKGAPRAMPYLFVVAMDESGFLNLPTVLSWSKGAPKRIRAARIEKTPRIALPRTTRVPTHILAGFIISEKEWILQTREDDSQGARHRAARTKEAERAEKRMMRGEGLTPCQGNLSCLLGAAPSDDSSQR